MSQLAKKKREQRYNAGSALTFQCFFLRVAVIYLSLPGYPFFKRPNLLTVWDFSKFSTPLRLRFHLL